MKRLITSIVSKDETIRLFHRFPLACIYTIMFSSELFYDILTDTEPNGVTIFYLLTGALLSFVLHLWGEEVKDRRISHTVMAIAHAMLLIDAIVLWMQTDDFFDEALFIAHGAVIFAMVIGAIFLPFYKEKNDLQAWNFASKIISWAAVSLAVAVMMYLGTALLLWGCEYLFLRHVNYETLRDFNKLYGIFAIIYFPLLGVAIFLSHIPKGAQKHSNTIIDSRFINGVARYLLLPLVLAYMAVLYIYLAKIMVSWELPRGTVSMLVTGMLVIILLIEIIVYPSMRSNEEKRFERRMVRYLPLLAIPLVVLMSVGIVRRFNDYGLTTNRLYIATLNIWYYIVCLGLYFTHAKRIHWIPLSFGLLLLLTSAQPLNYTKIGNLYGSADRPRVTPKDDSFFDNDNYNKTYIDYNRADESVPMPSGYSMMIPSNDYSYMSIAEAEADSIIDSGIITLKTEVKINGIEKGLEFAIPVAQIHQLEAAPETPIYFQEKSAGDSIVMFPTRIEFSAYSYHGTLNDGTNASFVQHFYIFIK